jgi:hypothetical protein
MSNTTTHNERRSRTGRRAITAIVLALAAIMVLPASSMAGKRFGAYLGGSPDPVDTAENCPTGAGTTCTRAPMYYDDPPHAGATPGAPKDGVIDKIRLVSDTPGEFRLQIVEEEFLGLANTELDVVRKGPKIQYQGTGQIEKFNVDVPVEKWQWIAMRTKFAGPLQCDAAGINTEAIAAPALTVSDPPTKANYYTGCTHLVQAELE